MIKGIKSTIQKMIDTAPSQWVDMFQHHGLGKKPKVDVLIDKVLEKTASGASSGSRGEAKYTVPRKVKQEAFEGLLLAHKHNWSSTSGIGLVRAMQLVLHPKIWERSVKRMHSYFTRHRNNRNSKAIKTGKKTWGPKNPTRGYIAHMAWGGDSGEKWASQQVKKKNPKASKRTLTGADAFIEQYHSLTFPAENSRHFQIGEHLSSTGVESTFKSSFRVWKLPNNCEIVTLLKKEQEHIYLSLIFVSPNCGRKGYASKVLQQLVNLSNLTGTMIGLHVAYSQDDETYGEKLFNWYEKHGFRFDENWYESIDGYDLVYFPKVSERLLTNPYLPLQNKKNALVPKEMVTLVGFDSDKTRQVEEEIPFVLGFIEQMREESLLFPTPIRAMTVDEFNNGRNTVDSGHPMGAGHGQINLKTFDIAINPMMDVFDIVTNIFHENLHYAFPHWKEETVRDATGLAMENLYGVFNLGRPFAEERNK